MRLSRRDFVKHASLAALAPRLARAQTTAPASLPIRVDLFPRYPELSGLGAKALLGFPLEDLFGFLF